MEKGGCIFIKGAYKEERWLSGNNVKMWFNG